VLAFITGCGSKSATLSPAAPSPASVTPPPTLILQPLAAGVAPTLVVNSPASGFSYAYAPSIIKTSDGTYHAYFCSTGDGQNGGGWDDIRHASSTDLVTWSAPDTLLVPTSYERSNCDPSVVFDQVDGVFYMYLGGNVVQDQTVVFVARSRSPDGPLLKWTGSDWEQNPAKSAIVIAPINPTTDSHFYGAGQPSVIIRNGVFYMWYSDDTGAGVPLAVHTYMATSFDGITWTSGTQTSVALGTNSVDVKWDASSAQWVMVEIVNQFGASSLVMQTSTDGITWDAPTTLQAAGRFPAGAHNPGISSDDQGALLTGSTLIAYGAPYAPAPVNAATGIACVGQLEFMDQ
jgi:sucrose-6-phosphate hydrolase SacC (GH32 family)